MVFKEMQKKASLLSCPIKVPLLISVFVIKHGNYLPFVMKCTKTQCRGNADQLRTYMVNIISHYKFPVNMTPIE